MPDDELAENKKLKYSKNQCRQENVYSRKTAGIGKDAEAQDVEAGSAPHKADEQQQGIAMNIYRRSPFYEQCSIWAL